MENLNAVWNEFSNQVFQREVSFRISSKLLNVEEHTKAQMAILRQKTENLRSKLLEHIVIAVEGNSHSVHPNQK